MWGHNSCNGVNDCSDGQDEMVCISNCDQNKFRCMHATGKYLPLECIDKELECDGKLDCKDGFDEDDCPTTCPEYIF